MNKNDKISKYITYGEVIRSTTAKRYNIPNIPTDEQLARVKDWAINLFDPMRERMGYAISCESIFRSYALNSSSYIRGARTSDHLANKGAAGDIDTDILGIGNNKDIFTDLYLHGDFDQIIWENGNDDEPDWVHAGYRKNANRHQVWRKTNGVYVKIDKLWYKH